MVNYAAMDLRSYLDASNTPIAAFAAKVGVTPQAIHRYIAGERLPKREVMLRINVVSDGAISANDFFPAPEDAASKPGAAQDAAA
jgi:hypothetical protein